MKHFLIFILLFVGSFSWAQDQIITKSKETINGRVVEEDKKKVYYYPTGDNELQLKELDRKQVKKIRFQTPAENSNAIVLSLKSISGKNLFSDVTAFLLKSGYQIEKFDTDLLRVITKMSSNNRIVVDVDENQAKFLSYEMIDETRGKTYSAGSKDVIKLEHRVEIRKEPEEFPGEELNFAGESEFKKMDKLCRQYLKEKKGTFAYGRK